MWGSLASAILASLLLIAACGKQEPAVVKQQSTSPAAAKQDANANTVSVNANDTAISPTFDPSTVPGMIRIDDKAYLLLSSTWPFNLTNGIATIPVCWEPNSSAGKERDWVRSAVIDSWQANSAGRLRFIGFGQCVAASKGIRIAVQDNGSNNGPHTVGLGKQLDGVKNGMILNFTFQTWSPACASSAAERELCIRSIAVHEFGHALGFAHEQNRPDTPGECTQKPQGANGDVLLTPWDSHSVMNYCNPVYNNDGKLSSYDIEGLHKAYHG